MLYIRPCASSCVQNAYVQGINNNPPLFIIFCEGFSLRQEDNLGSKRTYASKVLHEGLYLTFPG